MTDAPSTNLTQLAQLEQALGRTAAALADFCDAIDGTNDPQWLDAFAQSVAVSR